MTVVQKPAAAQRKRKDGFGRAGPVSEGSRQRAPLALQVFGAVLVVSSIIVGVFSSHASAASLSNGTVTVKLTPSGAVATSPLANHQMVDLSVAANSTLNRSSLESAGFASGVDVLKVLECSDVGGQPANLPKKPSDCEAETIQSSADLSPNGSFTLQGYTIYALPDGTELGPSSSGTTCDDSQHQCVLGFFSNQNDFTKPHLFSAPFQVTAAASSGSTGSTSASGGSSSGGSASGGVSPGVSVPPATLANTGAPTLWPWLLGGGCVLLVVGSALRFVRRPRYEGRP